MSFALFSLATFAYYNSLTPSDFKNIHSAINDIKKIKTEFDNEVQDYKYSREKARDRKVAARHKAAFVFHFLPYAIVPIAFIVALTLLCTLTLSTAGAHGVIFGCLLGAIALASIAFCISSKLADIKIDTKINHNVIRRKRLRFFKKMGPIMKDIEDVVTPNNELKN